MNPPLVTVVVPAFNAEPWMAESLSSVIAQSYPHDSLELIVVDDGSTDGTVAAADRILDDSGIAYGPAQPVRRRAQRVIRAGVRRSVAV
jgi:glycosyltransferase involved in cell wall biosynthesis